MSTMQPEREEVERENAALRRDAERYASALDHIARVALGSRQPTKRISWIVQRATSALNNDDAWRVTEKPAGYHDSLESDPT